MTCLTRFRPAFFLSFVVLCFSTVALAAPLNHVVGTFTYRGRQVDKIVVPGSPPPPGFRMPAVKLPRPNKARGTNSIANVPAMTWCFGCSATSAAMLFGHYDNILGYKNMYAGPTNGGVFPMTNASWGTVVLNGEVRAQCPLSATRNGVDGRTTSGHVDDYWIKYGNTDPDPWIANGRTEHTHGDCTGDYMGTNQSDVGNSDGSTIFYSYTDGSPLEDFTYYEPDVRDGCHGMKLFANSRGYNVVTNYSQYIMGYNGNTLGFTFADYTAEIDAGRPVLIQVDGHTMLGIDYDTTGDTVYLHDTWDYDTHTMTWGGDYSGMAHYGVAVIQVETPAAPTTPSLAVTPTSPTCLSTLQGVASGSTDGNGTTPTYEYQWAKCLGSTSASRSIAGRPSRAPLWDTWGHDSTDGILTGVTLTRGDLWRVQARATDGELTSSWTSPVEVTILNAAPTAPTQVEISPASPTCASSLTATATGGSDPDGDSTTWHYQWRLSGATWGYDSTDGALSATVARGEVWQVQACLNDGTTDGAWTQAEVTIGNTAPAAPTSLVIAPDPPVSSATLDAEAGGGTDADTGDTVTYRYQWSKLLSRRGSRSRTSELWTAWGHDSTDGVLSGVALTRGDVWRAHAASDDGTATSAYNTPVEVTIVNTPPQTVSVAVRPTAPVSTSNLTAAVRATDYDDDPVTYEVQWACCPERGAWGPWGNAGLTVDASLTTRGDQWKARMRASDGTDTSDWVESTAVTIENAVPTTPAALAIRPATPGDLTNLVPTLTGSTDADNDPLTYRYQWARSTNGGASWSVWGWTGRTLSNTFTATGELWKVRARAWDGLDNGKWRESAPVEIVNSRPRPPTSVVITPPFPAEDNTLTATADGYSDPDTSDTLTVEYAWRRGYANGEHWTAWSWAGPEIPHAQTMLGDLWQARARVSDGALASGWTLSEPVQIWDDPDTPVTVVAAAASTARGAELRVNLTQAATVEVAIRTVAGRTVRLLPGQSLAAGVTTLLWDGRGATGTTVPGGLYLVEVLATTPGGAQARSVTVLPLNR